MARVTESVLFYLISLTISAFCLGETLQARTELQNLEILTIFLEIFG
jgi:hypothetical protein